MAHANASDGVRLYYEETGAGAPVIFVHEFAGDHRSWEPQVRYFSRRYRCITYDARGYPPSDVPEGFERYSQERARDGMSLDPGLAGRAERGRHDEPSATSLGPPRLAQVILGKDPGPQHQGHHGVPEVAVGTRLGWA